MIGARRLTSSTRSISSGLSFGSVPEPGQAGVGDQHVHLTGLGDQPLDLGAIGEVGDDRASAELTAQRLQRVGATAAEDELGASL